MMVVNILICPVSFVKALGIFPPTDKSHQVQSLRDVVCRVLFVDVQYPTPSTATLILKSDHEWHCIMESLDDTVDGIRYVLSGMPKNFVSIHWAELISGGAVIEIDIVGVTASKQDGYSMNIIAKSNVLLKRRRLKGRQKRKKQLPGLFDPNFRKEIRSVLVVRVGGIDTSVTNSLTELSDSVFGTFGKKQSLKSQYDACSFGKLEFVQAEDKGILHGVVRIIVPEVLSGVDTGYVLNKVKKIADGKIDLSEESYDHIIYCMPPGVLKQQKVWLAYAELGGQRSVVYDEWCGSLSALMHEIGHNLGLYHAGMGNETYADASGYMGTSVLSSDGPLMCFNGAQSWQLGFYKDRHSTIPRAGLPWKKNLHGVSQYNLTRSRDTVIAKFVVNEGDGDLYFAFNLASGINKGTRTSQNEVTIVKSDMRETSFIASLSSMETTKIKINGGKDELHINVTDIYVNNSNVDVLDYATIEIYLYEENVGMD